MCNNNNSELQLSSAYRSMDRMLEQMNQKYNIVRFLMSANFSKESNTAKVENVDFVSILPSEFNSSQDD